MCKPSACSDFFLVPVPRDRLSQVVVESLDKALPPTAEALAAAAPVPPAPLWAFDVSIEPSLLSLLGLQRPEALRVATLDSGATDATAGVGSGGPWVLAQGADDPVAAQLGHPPPAGAPLPAWATLPARLQVFRLPPAPSPAGGGTAPAAPP